MGLLSKPDPIDDDLASAVVADDRATRKAVSREADGIRSALRHGELVLSIVADTHMGGVGVVTNQRVLVVHRGRVKKDADASRIRETKLGRMPSGRVLAMVEGPGFLIECATYAEANSFVNTIDAFLLR